MFETREIRNESTLHWLNFDFDWLNFDFDLANMYLTKGEPMLTTILDERIQEARQARADLAAHTEKQALADSLEWLEAEKQRQARIEAAETKLSACQLEMREMIELAKARIPVWRDEFQTAYEHLAGVVARLNETQAPLLLAVDAGKRAARAESELRGLRGQPAGNRLQADWREFGGNDETLNPLPEGSTDAMRAFLHQMGAGTIYSPKRGLSQFFR